MLNKPVTIRQMLIQGVLSGQNHAESIMMGARERGNW